MNRTTIFAALVSLSLGAAAGGSLVYETIPTREPKPCREARELTDEYLLGQANLVSAIQERAGAVGFIEVNQAHDKVQAITDELQPIAEAYAVAYEKCEASS